LRPEIVTFDSDGEKLVGNVFLPGSHRSGSKPSIIVVTGSWTTVKEQMPNHYARKLADEGFAALTFDFRGYGESGGAPRQYESPARKIRDIENAVKFAGTLPFISPGRIGGLAVCASVGYMAHAIARGVGIRSFATVAGWLHDASTVGQFYGGDEGVQKRVALARAAREKLERTDTVEYVAAYDPDDPEAAMSFPLDYYAKPSRGAVPQWKNQFAVMSWSEWLEFDGVAPASRIGVPTLLVHSDAAVFPDNVRRFHAALAGPKDLYWTQGEQIDFYDTEPLTTRAAQVAAAHYRATLGGVHAAAPA
jgi:fermentation-respiration switch protein FrsA (DUF1100 family)